MEPEAARPRTADDLFAVLRFVHTALERRGLWHCLLYGTLLGAVRDGDIIPWDHDLDLLVRPRDVPAILALGEELREDGLAFVAGVEPAVLFATNPGGVPWADPGRLSIMVGDQCYGELYAPILFRDGVLRCYDLEQEVVTWPRTALPAFAVEGLRTATVRGLPFPVPLHAEQMLEWTYGPGWREPYRSVRDGGEARDGHTEHGDLARPRLDEQLAWCEAQGWDRSEYAAQPAWPRPLRAAGPEGGHPRTVATSRSEWWHDVGEVGEHF